jgi:alpha-beta hydrolase superfamily lysophospholipase
MGPGPDLEATLQRDGLDFHVEHYQPSGEVRMALVTMHGFSAYCGLYRHVGHALAARGIAVTQFDGRGHGRSGGRRGHVQEFAEYLDDLGAIIEWARKQNPGVPWALMGHSLGGTIVASYVLDEKRPAKPGRLVLAAPWLKLKMKVPAPKRIGANVMAKIAPGFKSWNGLRGENISRNPAVIEGFDSDPLVFHHATAGGFMATLRAQAHVRTHAQDLKVPTLMLIAGADRIVANDAILAFAQGAGDVVTIKTYDELFHELFLELEAGTVLADIASWLTSPMPHKQTA